MLTDSHCHLTKEYYDNINEVIDEAKRNKVTRYINIGCDKFSMREVIDLIKTEDYMYGSIGIHPNEIYDTEEKDYNYIVENLDNKKIIAIGEIGLDYHYRSDDKKNQQKWFERQLKLATKNNKPVIIHSRDATEDTIKILKKYNLKGIIHSFSGSYETATEYIKMGYVLGINGVVTFKNSKLKEVIKKLALEYIVLETDSPYLTPEPKRGTKNEPKYILEIARFISNLKGTSVEELSEITNKNLRRIFDI